MVNGKFRDLPFTIYKPAHRDLIKQIIKISSFILLQCGVLAAQGDSTFVAWIQSEAVDGRSVFSGWFENRSPKVLTIKYRAEMVLGDSSDVRQGTSMALPRQPNLLLKAIFTVPKGSFDRISMEIFHRDELIASASHTGRTSNKNPIEPKTTLPPSVDPESPFSDEVEIEGLIFDETRSKLAHDFYEYFYAAWTQSDSTASVSSIAIRELPSRSGIGARVVVEVNELEFTQLNLPPRVDYLEEQARQLVEAILNFLNNPDAEGEIQVEELQGSGVY